MQPDISTTIGKTAHYKPPYSSTNGKTAHCCPSQPDRLTPCNIGTSFAVDNRSNVRTKAIIVKQLNSKTSMKKNVIDPKTMDATLRTILGNKPSTETQKPETVAEEMQEQVQESAQVQEQASETVQTDEVPQVNRRVSGKQRRASLEEYKETFLTVPTIEDRKPVFLNHGTRDALDRIVRMFGSRRMSVSGLVENIAKQHLAAYGEDIEAWRKL